MDPTNPANFLAAILRGGVLKSVDAGSTWKTTGLSNVNVTALAIDPTSPGVFFAALPDLGDRRLQSSAMMPTPRGGVRRSGDGGKTWSELGAGLGSAAIRALAIDARGLNLYAATSGGVFVWSLRPQPK
jgi:photosystem II stability/assembly factor-like uncharacterized protein